jgi:hypothetical protein
MDLATDQIASHVSLLIRHVRRNDLVGKTILALSNVPRHRVPILSTKSTTFPSPSTILHIPINFLSIFNTCTWKPKKNTPATALLLTGSFLAVKI